MKSEVKKIDSTKREVSIRLNGDIVKNKFDQVFEKINSTAKVPGFRPGHIPRDILEKHYSSAAHEQVLKELIPHLYNEAVQKEGLDAIGVPDIFDVKLDKNSLSFKANVEVTPEIKLRNYKGLRITYKKIEVNPDEIKRNIDALKESKKIESLDDTFARGMGYSSLPELEKTLERQIFIQKDNLQRQRIEGEIIKEIIKDLDFKLPPSLVNRQLQDLIRQVKLDLALKGKPRDEIEAEENKLLSELEPEAKNQVKVYLVLAAIAKKENIAIDNHMPGKVMEFLLREASWSIA